MEREEVGRSWRREKIPAETDKGPFAESGRSRKHRRGSFTDPRNRVGAIQAFTALATVASESVVASLLAAVHAATAAGDAHVHRIHRRHAGATGELCGNREWDEQQDRQDQERLQEMPTHTIEVYAMIEEIGCLASTPHPGTARPGTCPLSPGRGRDGGQPYRIHKRRTAEEPAWELQLRALTGSTPICDA